MKILPKILNEIKIVPANAKIHLYVNADDELVYGENNTGLQLDYAGYTIQPYTYHIFDMDIEDEPQDTLVEYVRDNLIYAIKMMSLDIKTEEELFFCREFGQIPYIYFTDDPSRDADEVSIDELYIGSEVYFNVRDEYTLEDIIGDWIIEEKEF